MKMTIRDLLSSYRDYAVIRLSVYDKDYSVKYLKVCFNPGSSLEWVYRDDNEELDKIADYQIKEWYVFADELRILIDETF